MPDNLAFLHVSSAVVMVLPKYSAEVVRRVAAMADTEVAYAEGGRIIVVLEAKDASAISARLTEIAALEGVLAAHLAFEHVDTPANGGEQA